MMDETTNQHSVSISVVIASGAGGDFIFKCLDSLIDQAGENDVELIVVDRVGDEIAVFIMENYPSVRLVQAYQSRRPSVPELRKHGVLESNGDVIAVIEEHCTANPNWVDVIRENFSDNDAAIGGPILDANYARWVDWVVYFSEYHNYLPPWISGERYLLNGANIAYKRESVLKYVDILDAGYWEVVLHPLLAKEGNFRSIPEMGIQHTGPFAYKYYLEQRYLLSRVWGGSQREKVSSLKRFLYLVAAPLLPFLLLLRIANKVLKSRKNLTRFLLVLPLMVPVTVAYVFGEWLGYLIGYGDALERVE